MYANEVETEEELKLPEIKTQLQSLYLEKFSL